MAGAPPRFPPACVCLRRVSTSRVGAHRRFRQRETGVDELARPQPRGARSPRFSRAAAQTALGTFDLAP